MIDGIVRFTKLTDGIALVNLAGTCHKKGLR